MDNRIAYQPSPDALAEVSVETNNYAADVGNVAGGVISNVIKSGTNELPRQRVRVLPEQRLRREQLVQQPLRAPRRPSARGTCSAPPWAARSSRTSCSSSWTTRASSQDRPGSATASVAPAAWRAGDLSELPDTGHRPPHGLPFPNNQIPVSRFSPTALAILNSPDYPLPNRDVTGVTGNYVSDSLGQTRAHQGDLRLDWNASANDKLFLRFSIDGVRQRDEQDGVPASPRLVQLGAVPQPGGELEPRLQLVADQRGPRRVQRDPHVRLPERLGRHRRGQRHLRDPRRPADRRA